MQASAQTFGASKAKHRPDRHNGPVQITDALSDVREKYHIEQKELGHGHYGVVRKCMNRETQEWFAIKSIRKSKVGKIEVLKREIQILKEVDHPNIIDLIDVYEDTKYLHLITEVCTGGELFDRIIAKTQSAEGHFSERDAANLIRDICDAINYCHEKKQIVHRDLKPENFLYKTKADNAPIKIIDFGLSRHDNQNFGIMKTKVGTPYYCAPEVLRREYTKSCDLWSIGVITYILLCGYPPFYGDTDTEIFESVRIGDFDFPSPDWDDISQDAKEFIIALLKKNPNERLTAGQCLKHKWIVTNMDKDKGNRGRAGSIVVDSQRGTEFQKYMAMERLKKEALATIAANLTQEEIGKLESIFKTIDKDGDGKLSLKDLDQSLSDDLFPASVRENLNQLREDLSVSDSDTLNWRGFVAATMDKNLIMRDDKIRSVFDHFKRSDSNYILATDLEQLMGPSQAKEIMAFVDTDGDGKIAYDDFATAIKESVEEDV